MVNVDTKSGEEADDVQNCSNLPNVISFAGNCPKDKMSAYEIYIEENFRNSKSIFEMMK